MNDLLHINLFSSLHDGHSVFFCKTDFLSSIFKELSNFRRNVILITGNSDYEINDEIIKQAPKSIKYWFAQNANSNNIFGIPIGLENASPCKIKGHGHVWPHALSKHSHISMAKAKTPSRYVYANFSINTNPNQRNYVADLCVSSDHITTDIISEHSKINQKKYSNYINGILDHKMVICPEGNGIDCHRIWEVLLLGRVPVVKKSKIMSHFQDLPILYVDEWIEIKNIELINQKYNLVRNNSAEKLNFKYWKTFILSLKDKLKNK